MSVANSPAVSASVVDLLQSVCRSLREHSGASLEFPPHLQVSDPRQLKEFCVGLLENPDTHPWGRELSRHDGRKALSVSGSLFLFRKCLPATWDESEMMRKHRSAFIPECRAERSPLPDGYLRHVRRVVASQFPRGWDRGYSSACWNAVPTVGSCTGSPRSRGGARALMPDRSSFLSGVLGSRTFDVVNDVKYMVVPTGGKGRGVTIADPSMGFLSPLHTKIYDHLSTLPWLLRGEAKPGAFRAFFRKEGEVFVSGDYESASDNLRVEVADTILDVLQGSSDRVPASVWAAARSFLRCKISYEDIAYPLQSEGQLMGNLLCFPLLCLQNYVAFRYIFDDTVPVKINGDDIVFRAPVAEYCRWADFVTSVGLVLSRGKTLVSEKFFSLNSSFFWTRVSKRPPRAVPVCRVACFTKKLEDWGALSGSMRSFTRGFVGEARIQLEAFFLRRFSSWIKKSGRSVRRGLGVRCLKPSLQRAGLWRRECWYFESVPAETDVLPVSPSRLKWSTIPPGWKRVDANSCAATGAVEFHPEGRFPVKPTPRRLTRRVEELQRVFWSELASQAWTNPASRGTLVKDYQSEVIMSGREGSYRDWKLGRFRYRGFVRRKRTKLQDDYFRKCRVESHAADKWVPPGRQTYVWLPLEEEPPQVEEETEVSDLWEYEEISFSPPEYFADLRFGLGYR
nr:MAG: putative RNA-dependent RNA polymerase [Botourmiaviridae sp.]